MRRPKTSFKIANDQIETLRIKDLEAIKRNREIEIETRLDLLMSEIKAKFFGALLDANHYTRLAIAIDKNIAALLNTRTYRNHFSSNLAFKLAEISSSLYTLSTGVLIAKKEISQRIVEWKNQLEISKVENNVIYFSTLEGYNKLIEWFLAYAMEGIHNEETHAVSSKEADPILGLFSYEEMDCLFFAEKSLLEMEAQSNTPKLD